MQKICNIQTKEKKTSKFFYGSILYFGMYS